MKQVEITVKVNEPINKIKEKLLNQNFKIIRKSRVEDIYMTDKEEKSIIETLKTCVLLRYLKTDKEIKKLTYKDKIYNGNKVISEEKINVEIDSIENAKKLFEKLNFKVLTEVKYNVIVFEKEGVELAIQDVENLGILLEYESDKDFEGKENLVEKEQEKMYNKLKEYNLNTGEDYCVKKAYELIKKDH